MAEQAATLIDALAADLLRRSAENERLVPFAEQLRDVDCSSARHVPPEPFEHPAMRFLDPAVKTASGVPDVLRASRGIAHEIQWYQIFQDADLDAALAEGLLAAQVVGDVGLFSSNDIRCGMFLIAPGVHYPLHTHRASEVYYCLSGELEIAHAIEAGSFRLSPGDLSITPSNRVHSLTTHDDPVLLLYIWIGDIQSPNWWWERRPDGGWSRTKWVRMPDASWTRTATEPVTENVMREATSA